MISIIVIDMAYFLILVLTPGAVALSKFINNKFALPILTTISVYFPFLLEVQDSMLRGMTLLLFWTFLQSVLTLYFSYRDPVGMGNLIWRAEEYTRSMLQWIQTGQLPEGFGRNVLLFHLKQTLVYWVLAFFSANFLSLMLGSALLNYMNYYVAQVMRGSRRKKLALLMGWNPWSIVRVISFLYLGILFGAPLLSRFLPLGFSLSAATLIPGIIGIILDVLMKITISPVWSRRLKDNSI